MVLVPLFLPLNLSNELSNVSENRLIRIKWYVKFESNRKVWMINTFIQSPLRFFIHMQSDTKTNQGITASEYT